MSSQSPASAPSVPPASIRLLWPLQPHYTGLSYVMQVKVLAGGVAGFMDSYKGDSEVAVLPAQGWDPAQK